MGRPVLIDQRTWDQGIAERYRATEVEGTFCYTFFKTFAAKETRGRGVPPTDLSLLLSRASERCVYPSFTVC